MKHNIVTRFTLSGSRIAHINKTSNADAHACYDKDTIVHKHNFVDIHRCVVLIYVLELARFENVKTSAFDKRLQYVTSASHSFAEQNAEQDKDIKSRLENENVFNLTVLFRPFRALQITHTKNGGLHHRLCYIRPSALNQTMLDFILVCKFKNEPTISTSIFSSATARFVRRCIRSLWCPSVGAQGECQVRQWGAARLAAICQHHLSPLGRRGCRCR